MTDVTILSHDPNHNSSRGQCGDPENAANHQHRIDGHSSEACTSQQRCVDNTEKGEITKSKVQKLQSLNIADDLRKLFLGDPAIAGPMMSAKYLVKKSTHQKVQNEEGKAKESRKSVSCQQSRPHEHGSYAVSTDQHISDSVFSSSMHLYRLRSTSQLLDRAVSNTTISRGTAAKVMGGGPVKAKPLLPPPTEVEEEKVKCCGFPTACDDSCLNVLDLSHQRLARLPCLHTTDAVSLHCSGEDMAGRVSVLNLSNNRLKSLVSSPPQVTNVGPPSKPKQTDIKEHERHLSSFPRSCPLAIFRNVSSLDLSNNSISSLDGIGALLSLRSLRLTRNAITTLSGLWRSPFIGKLDMLDVSENRIKQLVSPDDVKALEQNPPRSLLVLRINNNLLRSLPDCLSMFKQLQVIRVRANKLTSVPDTFPSASFCPKVRFIDFSANHLSSKDQMDLQRRISALEKVTFDTLHDDLHKHTESISFDLSRNKNREATPVVLQTTDSSLSSPEIVGTDRKHRGAAFSKINPHEKGHGYSREQTEIRARYAEIIPLDLEDIRSTHVSSTARFQPFQSPGARNNANTATISLRIASLTISDPKRRRSLKKEQPRLERSPMSALRLGLERSEGEPMMLGVNIWYIDVLKLLENLEMDLLAAGGRYRNLISRLASSTALGLWDHIPLLGLVYCEGEFHSPATLILCNITASCATNPHCAVLVYQILRSITILNPEQYSRYLKCAKKQPEGGASTTPSFALPSVVAVGTPNHASKDGLPLRIQVHHLFHAEDSDRAAALARGPFHNDAGLWAYLRWRRAWEARARRGGFLAQNAYARALGGALGPGDLAGLLDRRADAPSRGADAAALLPLPPPWPQLYDFLSFKCKGARSPMKGEARTGLARIPGPSDAGPAPFADGIPPLRERGPSSILVDALGPQMRAWPAKALETPRALDGGGGIIEEDADRLASEPLDYVALSLRLLSYVRRSMEDTERMVEESVARAQVSCPLVSYSPRAIDAARRTASSKAHLLPCNADKRDINGGIPDVPSAKFLPQREPDMYSGN